ncbi:hypothetical protein [uncultured Parabacteroides sp.]|jgi:hypothetical protein|uniref:hypothetical protein n=1 Tax=uncultured Parabacteroides sp. TaxID=512312 RepID=UPI0025D9DFA3|nr:hypothetical protein [uncultured Parabacteroides sp.]
MDHAKYLESHPEYRSLFPTQKMYDDFVRFMEMDEEERRLLAEEDKKRVDAMSPDERERDWQNVIKGVNLFIEFAKEEIPKLAYEKKMLEASKRQNKVTWEDIRKKLNNIASL